MVLFKHIVLESQLDSEPLPKLQITIDNGIGKFLQESGLRHYLYLPIANRPLSERFADDQPNAPNSFAPLAVVFSTVDRNEPRQVFLKLQPDKRVAEVVNPGYGDSSYMVKTTADSTATPAHAEVNVALTGESKVKDSCQSAYGTFDSSIGERKDRSLLVESLRKTSHDPAADTGSNKSSAVVSIGSSLQCSKLTHVSISEVQAKSKKKISLQDRLVATFSSRVLKSESDKHAAVSSRKMPAGADNSLSTFPNAGEQVFDTMSSFLPSVNRNSVFSPLDVDVDHDNFEGVYSSQPTPPPAILVRDDPRLRWNVSLKTSDHTADTTEVKSSFDREVLQGPNIDHSEDLNLQLEITSSSSSSTSREATPSGRKTGISSKKIQESTKKKPIPAKLSKSLPGRTETWRMLDAALHQPKLPKLPSSDAKEQENPKDKESKLPLSTREANLPQLQSGQLQHNSKTPGLNDEKSQKISSSQTPQKKGVDGSANENSKMQPAASVSISSSVQCQPLPTFYGKPFVGQGSPRIILLESKREIVLSDPRWCEKSQFKTLIDLKLTKFHLKSGQVACSSDELAAVASRPEEAADTTVRSLKSTNECGQSEGRLVASCISVEEETVDIGSSSTTATEVVPSADARSNDVSTRIVSGGLQRRYSGPRTPPPPPEANVPRTSIESSDNDTVETTTTTVRRHSPPGTDAEDSNVASRPRDVPRTPPPEMNVRGTSVGSNDNDTVETIATTLRRISPPGTDADDSVFDVDDAQAVQKASAAAASSVKDEAVVNDDDDTEIDSGSREVAAELTRRGGPRIPPEADGVRDVSDLEGVKKATVRRSSGPRTPPETDADVMSQREQTASTMPLSSTKITSAVMTDDDIVGRQIEEVRPVPTKARSASQNSGVDETGREIDSSLKDPTTGDDSVRSQLAKDASSEPDAEEMTKVSELLSDVCGLVAKLFPSATATSARPIVDGDASDKRLETVAEAIPVITGTTLGAKQAKFVEPSAKSNASETECKIAVVVDSCRNRQPTFSWDWELGHRDVVTSSDVSVRHASRKEEQERAAEECEITNVETVGRTTAHESRRSPSYVCDDADCAKVNSTIDSIVVRIHSLRAEFRKQPFFSLKQVDRELKKYEEELHEVRQLHHVTDVGQSESVRSLPHAAGKSRFVDFTVEDEEQNVKQRKRMLNVSSSSNGNDSSKSGRSSRDSDHKKKRRHKSSKKSKGSRSPCSVAMARDKSERGECEKQKKQEKREHSSSESAHSSRDFHQKKRHRYD